VGARERLPVGRETCANAAEGGHLEVLKWARENGCPWDERTCANAAEGGHLEVLKWARENGCPWDEGRARTRRGRPPRGAEVGARERLPVGRGRTCANAAKGGHLEVLKWARENGCPWDEGRARTRRRAATSRC